MADALLAHEKNGDDNAETDGGTFADLLTRQLREVSHDRHLGVIYNPFKTAPTSEDDARHRRELERDNCAFEKIEILPGNIGYLKFNAFPDPSVCRPTVVAAMNFLGHVDALIFDLRDNHGGDPHMVALIATYLFDHSTHLNDMYIPKSNTTQQYWTLPPVPGNKLANKPAYVLTSASTFSGGEEFSYDLKMLKRATLVGETTGGGAHPVSGHRIDDHFMIGVPFARPINPISKTNWEGAGVEPDVKVKAADALQTAEKLAESKLQKK
jgi:C-terminal processing protease CtpA/Prc